MHKTQSKPLAENRYYKEIGWLLAVKICLLIVLRLLFFGHDKVAPNDDIATASHLLNASITQEHPASLENRSNHDQ